MKLPDYNSDTKLNSLRAMMGAELVSIFTNRSDFHADINEIRRRLSGDGIEIKFNEIEIIDDYTFEYKGQKVLVYIRDQKVAYSGYKYHVTNCSTIQGYLGRNAIDRYVVTNRTDGKFKVNLIGLDGFIQKQNADVEMKVCKNCLEQLRYKGYSGHGNRRSKEIYNGFSLKEFFESYKSTQHIHLPTHDDITAPVQIYTKDFNGISQELRERKNWICEQCNGNFGQNKQNLHVHHKNGVVSDNSLSNLEVLCKTCHQSRHSHLIGE
ncbi:MAG: HNH endonuclease [Candidatus Kapabacteria bacterium]|nr:HNH endonuclease [Ignavibacteriota bacterium]MCW5883411.1 HNH endonuclease [Candidatus Kapabacteria bacterium]